VPRILIVEDEPDLRELLDLGLRSAGYEVDVACEGRAALRLMQEHPPDVAVLDLMLPDMDGTEICQALRRETRTERAGVIVVSARIELLDRLDAFEKGADDYMTKPFSFRELLLRIQALLRRNGLTRPTLPAPQPVRRS
jgi:DNA-binding response OmpR family regulator